jgi:hypothetical protein
MVPLMSLWLPIVVSAVFVFIVSSIIHMVLPIHKGDYGQLPNEEAVATALAGTPPGEYVIPYANSMKAMKEPSYMERMNRGPVGVVTVGPNGMPNMGSSLLQWFLYSLLVSLFAAYVASRAGAGPDYLDVFRFTGATAFAGYALALLQGPIWFRKPWGTTMKNVFDGLIYALVTAGAFGWLWPNS